MCPEMVDEANPGKEGPPRCREYMADSSVVLLTALALRCSRFLRASANIFSIESAGALGNWSAPGGAILCLVFPRVGVQALPSAPENRSHAPSQLQRDPIRKPPSM